MNYPRPGEPIVPRLLRPLVLDRHPGSFVGDRDSELIAHHDLGADAWERLPAEVCRRVSLLVVDRVQTRLRALPDAVRDTPLPAPDAALASLPLERRTINTLRRAGAARADDGPWTVRRYIEIRRFGGRALVDLLAAVEARAGVSLPTLTHAGLGDDRALNKLLVSISRRLPIAERRLDHAFGRDGQAPPLDVTHLLKSATQLGHELSFRVIELGDTRVVVRLSDLTTARAAYRIAVRTVRTLGAATLDGIAGQVNATTRSAIDATFVEGLLSGLTAFRWLDQRGGWFWFLQRSNPLLANVRKVLSVATRLPIVRLTSILFRTRAGPRPSPAVVQSLCRALPEARITGGMVMVDRPLDRRAHLNEEESRVVKVLETAGGGMSDAQLRWSIREIGLSWTPIWRLLRSSPLFEQSPEGRFRLVGSH